MSTASRVKQMVRGPLEAVAGPAVGSIASIRTDHQELVVTFDDGPLPGTTDALAEVLATHDAKAVFFVLGTRVKRDPGLVRELAAAGHEIGLHGLDHRTVRGMSPRQAFDWLQRGRGELTDVLGSRVDWFRPPHGAQSPLTRVMAGRLGMGTVLWSGTTWDWKDVSHAERVAKAMSDARPGAILLAHDGAADASDLAREEAVTGVDKPRLLDEVLTGFAERGLRSVTLTEALAHGSAVNRLSFSR